VTSSDLGVRAMLDLTTQFLVTQSASPPDALHQAYGVLAATMNRQAAIFAFLDCFWLLGLIAIIGLPLACCIRWFHAGSPGAGGH
jgi:MFS transporter, DHA2 family, multidrug resistance protein